MFRYLVQQQPEGEAIPRDGEVGGLTSREGGIGSPKSSSDGGDDADNTESSPAGSVHTETASSLKFRFRLFGYRREGKPSRAPY